MAKSNEKTAEAEKAVEEKVAGEVSVEETVKETKPQGKVEENKPEATGETLKRIEELLTRQEQTNKKMLRSSRLRSLMSVIIASVFVVMCFVLYNMMKGVPTLVDSANTLVTEATGDLEDVMKQIKGIDFDSMNEALQGIASVDYEAMNDSIQSLQKGAEAFQAFAEALASPFAAFGR